jgi:uncharacterized membrane protein YphA (DoxX/SURF4 family)
MSIAGVMTRLAAVLLGLFLIGMPAFAEGPAYPGQVVHGFDYGSAR